jgi:multiple sugar transport system permease protein
MLSSVRGAGSLALPLRNIGPVIGLAGFILLGQGLATLWMKPRQLNAWFWVLPAIVFILVIVIIPTIYAFGVSTFRWEARVADQEFAFLQNYVDLAETARFRGALLNTAIIALSVLCLEFILGVGLALLFVEWFPGRSIILAILLLPLMVAPVVVGQTWRMLWDPRFGAVNDFLSRLTGQSVQLLWLGNPGLAYIAIVVTDLWQWTPFVFLIALAGLMSINTELYEAAAIDGASSRQIIWRVSLPLIRPVLLVALLLRLFDALKIFDTVHILTQGGPGSVTETFSYYLYQQFKFGSYGLTAAGGIIFLIIVVLLSTIIIRRIGET